MKKKRIKIIENHSLVLHYDCTRSEYLNLYGVEHEYDSQSDGSCYRVDGLNPMVWVKDLKNYPSLSHELLHAIFHIAKTVGIEYNEGSEEWFTYSLGYAMSEVLKIKDLK